MRVPLRIAAHGLELGGTERAAIRAAVDKLETFFDRLMGCRVTVTVSNRYQQAEPVAYNVRINLTVPGDELVIQRHPGTSLTGAIQEAFHAAGRRLQDYAVQLRSVAPPEARTVPQRGTVARILPWDGFGFLEADDGHEVYFHRNSVLHHGFDRLVAGSEVLFTEEEGDHGPQASTVEISRIRLAAGH